MTRNFSFTFLIIAFLLPLFAFAIDHAPLSEGHEDDAEQFIERHLKVEGKYNVGKVQDFLERLKKEKQSLMEDIYETELIEGLELEVKDFQKAKKKALKEIDENKNKFLVAYNQYLIPKMEELLKSVQTNAPEEKTQGLMDDFIRGYIAFYIPNAKRTALPQDINITKVARHFFKPYVFRKDHQKVEANNLIVESENLQEIVNCFGQGSKVQVGHYLTEPELQLLKKCSFDISRLNPGTSPFWRKLSPADKQKIYDIRQDLFPRPEDKITFDKVKITGLGSPKFEATFVRDGKEKSIKIKMGQEVHAEIVTSLTGRLLGLNQDIMLYRPEVKVYLGKTSYQEFSIQIANKYGQTKLNRFIDGHGGPLGNEWVILKDVLFEGSLSEELRLGGLDTESWDLLNRREYRSLLLWYAWYSIMDAKTDNFKTLLTKTKEGLTVQHRLQDTGYSLGATLVVKRPRDLVRNIDKFKVNQFVLSVIDWNQDKDVVTVWWNDFVNYTKRFSTTTWDDLKWMARNIAKISDEDLYFAIRSSGMPEELVGLYHHKIANRRNEFVEAFGLEQEYGLLPVPDLATYSPNSHIKNSVLVDPYFEGHHEDSTDPNLLFAAIGGMGDFAEFGIPFGKLAKQLTNAISGFVGVGMEGLGGLRADLGLELSKSMPVISPVTTMSVSPGIAIVVGRSVGLNISGGAEPYFVKDTMAIEINFSAAIFHQITPYLPVSIQAGFKVYRKEYQFVHYAKTVKEAYFSPFKLFNIIPSPKSYAAFHLDPHEVIKVEDAYGFEVEAAVSAFNVGPLLTNEVGVAVGWRRTTPAYFVRDQFGALHVYKEKSTKLYAGLHFHLAQVNLLVAALPLLGLEFTYQRYFYEAVDYAFTLPTYELGGSVVDQARRKREYEAMLDLFSSKSEKEDDISVLIRENFHMKARGAKTKLNLGFLFLFHRKMENGHSEAHVTLADGSKRSFYRYFMEKKLKNGVPVDLIPQVEDALTFKGSTTKVVVEMEGENKENMVGMVRTLDFYPTRSKDQLDDYIERLNEKFSEADETPFYRNYVLPEPEEVNKYRKVYGHTRIFINGKGLLEKAISLSANDMREITKKYFGEGILEGRRTRNPFTRMGRAVNHKIMVDGLMKSFLHLKWAAKNTGKIPKTLVRAVGDFLFKTHAELYGVNLLQEMLGNENVYVMGEIFGVYRSFSTLPKTDPNVGRRFAGKSWGVYGVVPPIQKFLFGDKPLPPSLFISAAIPHEDIFGELPTGVAPMD